MFSDIARIFQRVPTIIRRAPLIFLLPILAEGLQHIAEFCLGMYVSADGMAAAGGSSVRLAFGMVKILSLFYVIMWLSRFWFQGGKKTSLSFDGREFFYLSVMLGVGALLVGFIFTVGPVLVGWAQTSQLAIPQGLLPWLPILILLVFGYPVQLFSFYWFGRFLADDRMSLGVARAASKKQFSMMAITFIPITPFMVAHYYLGYQAVGLIPIQQLILLSLDSVLVGVMALILGNSVWAFHERAVRGVETL